jgi:predicted porin
MVGVTSALVKPKFTWNLNYYGGPDNANTTDGARHLIDTTLTLTPTPKFSAYINYDFGRNKDAIVKGVGDTKTNEWQGVAVAARGQVTPKAALAGRFEYYNDKNGFTTGTLQKLKEFTATYEYKWVEGLLARVEYRGDFSDQKFFHKNDTGMEKSQSTVTVGLVAFFGPKR